MNRLPSLAPLLGCALTLAGFATAPALAQDDAGDKVNQVIIYGDDECPRSDADTITVCARMDESERYRIPERLRESGDPANKAWAERVKSFETVGDFGQMSCSTVGLGSAQGCTADFIEAAYAERAQGSAVRFGQLISEARQERLSTIDAEAADTQSRVEELERAYTERLRREQGAEIAPTSSATDSATGQTPGAAASATPSSRDTLARPPEDAAPQDN